MHRHTTTIRLVATTLALVGLIALCRSSARGGDVTVVGSPRLNESVANQPPCDLQFDTPPSFADAAPPETPLFRPADPLCESKWYGRVEAYFWTDWALGVKTGDESGAMYTLGYQRRVGPETFRAEVFGSAMPIDRVFINDDVPFAATHSETHYYGFRGEYEYRWNMMADPFPAIWLYLGVGSRIWSRDIEDSITTEGPLYYCFGRKETWWTVYPYVGVETRRPFCGICDYFVSARMGATAITYRQEYRNPYDQINTFYPRPDITGQVRCGLQGEYLSVNFYFEAMTWQTSESEHIHGTNESVRRYIDSANMFTVGLEAAVRF